MNVFKAMYSRESTRDFSSVEPAPEDINQILQAAMSAPVSRCRYDAYNMTVIKDKELIQNIIDISEVNTSRPNAPLFSAPVLILISAAIAADGAPENISAGAMAQNIAIAARALGLGSLIVRSIIEPIRADEEILHKLAVPKEMTPLVAVAVGYSKSLLEEHSRSRHIISVNVL